MTFSNTKLKDGAKHTITFTYNVDVVEGVPTFYGKVDIKNCCTTTSTRTINLGGGKYNSRNQRDHFRFCMEFSKKGEEYKWRE